MEAWYNLEENQTPEKLLALAKQEKERIAFFAKFKVTDELKKKCPNTFGRYDTHILAGKEVAALVETVVQKATKLHNLKRENIGEIEELIHKGITVSFRCLKMLALIEGYADAETWP